MEVEKHDGYRNQYLVTLDEEELENLKDNAYEHDTTAERVIENVFLEVVS